MDFDEYEYLEKTVEKPNNNNALQDIPVNNPDDDKKKKKKTSRHKSVDNNNDDDDSNHHRSKRARSNDDDVRDRDKDRDRRRDKDKERHRSSSRHRSSPDRRDRDRVSDKERHRRSSRDREERNGRDRDREREKERDKERERRREREREREMELELERKRRSRSRSERRRSEREEREKSRDREIRERDARSYKEKKEEAEPEADPERDQRTVFAYQIALKADERDVYDFFSRAGKVRDVRLIMDRNSRRSKGVGYIEFYDAMSVPMAIALSGQPLLNQPVMVKPSEAEKNLVQSTTAIVGPGGSIGPYSGGARRLYVGNLHINITEEQLRQVFEPFGQVELVQLPLDPVTGLCKGFGFVQYARLEDARAAQNLNGQLDIAGRTIKVSAVSDQVGMQEIGVNAADFDDEEGGGMYLNAGSRAMLMQKLDRSGITSTLPNSVVNAPGLPPVVPPSSFLPPVPSVNISGFDSIGVPSECLLLKNMFDPKAETEPDFELDIRDDVQDECSKFGQVKHIYVDKYSAGCVYLRFDSTQSAMNAQRALHGRWFAGKLIEATYMVPLNYEAKFPESR